MVKKSWFPYAGLFAAAFAVYAGSLHAPFIFDDVHTIVTNEGLRDLGNLKKVFTSEYAGRPFLFFTFALNYAAGYLDPFGYHLVNVILHWGTSCLVFLILAEILAQEGIDDRLWAALGASLFALHPMAVEAVAYTASRSDGLSTFLYLLAFYLLIRCGFRFSLRFAVALVAFALALLTKETAVTFPALAVAFALAYGKADRDSVRPVAALWLVLPLYFLFRALALGHPLEEGVGREVSSKEYFLTQLTVVPFQYIPRLFVPVRQILDADLNLVDTILNPATLLGGAAILALLAFAFVRFRASRLYAFSILWFFGALSITSSFYPIFDAYVERRLYLALPAFCLAAAYSLYLLETKASLPRKKILAVAAAVLIVFGWLARERSNLFADPILVMEDNISKTISNPRLHIGLYREYLKAGMEGKAEERLLFAAKAFPTSPLVQLEYCRLLASRGEFDKLERILADVTPVRPTEFAEYYDFKGVIDGQKGNYDAAMRYFRMALTTDPRNVDTRANVIVLLQITGKNDEALRYARQAVKDSPREADLHYQLGVLLLGKDANAAQDEFRTVLKLQPSHRGGRKMMETPGGIPG